MAKMQVFTYDSLTMYDGLLKGYVDAADAESIKAISISENTLKCYKVKNPTAETVADIEITLPETDLTEINAKIKANADAIAAINDENTGILKTAKDYADTKVGELADGAVASNTSAIETLNGDETTAGSVKKAVKDASDTINTKIGDVSTLETTEKTNLVGALNELKGDIEDAQSAGEVTIDTSVTTEGMSKSYTFKQNGATIGVVDVPKDMVLQSGVVEKDPEGQPVGTYLVLTLANATNDKVYVNVGTLVDIYTAEQSATQIQLNINSSTREISATVVAGSITATELAANSVTTAKIADGNVTLVKLATEVTDAIADAKKAGTDASDAVTALETGAVKTNADNIASLQGLVGEGFEEISEAEIQGLFA